MSLNLVNMIKDEDVGIITIHNPPQNVLSAEVIEGLLKCTKEVNDNPGYRALVLTGAGSKTFSAGADINALLEMITDSLPFLKIPEIFSALEQLPIPTIAALDGHAMGGGLEMALTLDIRIASENILLGLPEIKLGIFPAGGGTQRLPRLIGKPRAKEMIFSGELIKAEEAMRIGLINRIVPEGEALSASITLAKQLAKGAGTAMRIIKEAIDKGMELSLEDGLKLEAELFKKVLQTEDAREGIQAFLERKKITFKHR